MHQTLRLLAPLLALVAAAVAAAPASARRHPRPPHVERQVIVLINAVRGHYQEPPLRISRRMSATAASYSRRLARTGYFAHGAWLSRIGRTAGTSQVGECLGWVSGKPARRQARWIVSAWLRSPEHRVVLLDPSFRRVGVGRKRGGGRTWFTLDVAR